MDNMTTYLLIASAVSILAAIIGTLLNTWFVKRRTKDASEDEIIRIDTVQRATEEPITSELPKIPGKYGELRIIKGGPIQIWILEQPQIKIGRSTEMDIYLDSPAVSRKHAEIERKNDNFFISDCGSTNGIVVNGEKIKEVIELHDGDTVKIGQFELLFSVLEIDKNN